MALTQHNNMANSASHRIGMTTVSWCILFLIYTAHIQAESIPKVEAFFQGHCSYLSPCHQRCINLPQGGYECACYDEYYLHPNGFSCIEVQIPTLLPTVTHTQEPELLDDDEDVENEFTPTTTPAPSDGNVAGLEDLAWDQFLRTNVHKYDDKVHNDDEVMLGDGPGVYDISSEQAQAQAMVSPDEDKDKRNRDRNRDHRRKGGRRRKLKYGRGKSVLADATLMEDNDLSTPASSKIPDSDMNEESNNFIFEKTTKPPVRYHTCDDLRCHAGGRCVPDSMRDGVRCQCRLGNSGDYCEKDIVVRYPKFMGTGYIAFPVLRGAFKEFTITVDFRPDTQNGLLVFSAEYPNAKSDFFSISLVDGYAEFRFDCGTGMSQITTRNMVNLRDWNTITVHRNDWNGWVQLNDGPQAKGRSRGLFSRITFREDLYVGGYRNNSFISERTGMAWGFVGCVRKLEVNNKVYDMRKGAFVGDAIHGVDVAECSDNVCENVHCQHGGTCVADTADTHACLCPLGKVGDRCENVIDIHVASFKGNSYLQYIGLRRTVLSYAEIEVVFKAEDPDGLIIYNGYTTDRSGDFISLALVNGYMEFRFDLGTGPAIIRSRQPVSLNEWHLVRVWRTGRDGYLILDDQTAIKGMSKGAYTQLTLTLDLFVGGHRNFDEVARGAGIKTSFKGCIQKIVINQDPLKLMEDVISGVNIDNCNHPCSGQPCLNGGRCVPINDFYRCNCPIGFENTQCEDQLKKPIYTPMFSGDGYLMYVDPFIIQRLRGNKIDIQMRIRVAAPDGLLFWTGEEEMTTSSDYLAIGLKGGHVQLGYNLGSGPVVITYNESRIDDNRWHKIRAQRYERVGYLEIDGTEVIEGTSPGNLKQLNTEAKLYIGGMGDIVHQTMRKHFKGFVGCISNITLATDYHVDLLGEVAEGQNVRECL